MATIRFEIPEASKAQMTGHDGKLDSSNFDWLDHRE
jgi:hypothetical protein